MAELYRRQDALAHRGLRATAPQPGARVALSLLDGRTQLALRGDAGDRGFLSAVRSVTGAEPPGEANRAVSGQGVDLLWMGPDEWLLVWGESDAQAQSRLEAALGSCHSLVSDVSSSRGILCLRGGGAREVLARGCSLDLHPRCFGPGQVAQSALARAHALLHQVDALPTFHVYVHRSFCDYMYAWLLDASTELREAT